jgi:putative transposase
MTHKRKTNDAKKVTVDEPQMKSVLMAQPDFLMPVVQEAVQAMLEVEMEEYFQAGKHERNEERLGYRSGYYRRRLITRVGTIVLRVPQDRAVHSSTQVFEQYQLSEKALVAALAQMYVQGVSTRKVAAITPELCGHEFSASSISAFTARLDAQLEEFSGRALKEAFPYLVVDARYERVREGGVIVSRAILIALGIDWEGLRQVVAVEYANRESQSSWKEFLLRLKERGLQGVQFVVSDDHPGLKAAIQEVLPGVWWQRCYVHFLRNALDYLPRKADDDCLQELRWMYERRNVEEARRDLKGWV